MEAPSPQGTSHPPEPIHFRAGKKRKAYRQRSSAEEDDLAYAVATTSTALPRASSPRDAHDDNAEDAEYGDGTAEESSVAAALRLRNARRTARLRGGVGFRSDGLHDDDESEQGLVTRGGGQNVMAADATGRISSRFMHQTGLLTILDDKHINAYVESRLAKSKPGTSNTPSTEQYSSTRAPDSDAGHEPASSSSSSNNNNNIRKLIHQPTRQGRLIEVEIPDDLRERASEHKRRSSGKPNNSNKPPPRRNRNRRTSDDIARDNLVDQFLHENRLDVYDIPSPSESQPVSNPGDDPSADERLAKQFRQQYLDEQALRRKRKRPAQQLPQAQRSRQPANDVLKGPKLGGSRNARAAVRDMLLQQEKDKKGK